MFNEIQNSGSGFRNGSESVHNAFIMNSSKYNFNVLSKIRAQMLLYIGLHIMYSKTRQSNRMEDSGRNQSEIKGHDTKINGETLHMHKPLNLKVNLRHTSSSS